MIAEASTYRKLSIQKKKRENAKGGFYLKDNRPKILQRVRQQERNNDSATQGEALQTGQRTVQMKKAHSNQLKGKDLCNSSFPIQLVRVGLAEYGLAGKERAPVVEKYHHSAEQQAAQRISFGGGNTVRIGGMSIADYNQTVWGMKFNPAWSGRLQYVVDTHGVFYGEYYPPGINERKNEYHSRFKAGGNVISAGWMRMKGDKVIHVANDSGHYKPGTDGFYKMILILEKLGVDTRRIKKARADLGAGLKNSNTKEIRESLHPDDVKQIKAEVNALFQKADEVAQAPQEEDSEVKPEVKRFKELVLQLRMVEGLFEHEKNQEKRDSVSGIMAEAVEVLGRIDASITQKKEVHQDSFRLAEVLILQAENRLKAPKAIV